MTSPLPTVYHNTISFGTTGVSEVGKRIFNAVKTLFASAAIYTSPKLSRLEGERVNLEWCGDGHWTDMNVKGCNERQLAARILETYLVSQDINVLALVKGSEKYIFLFTDENRGEALRTLGRYASDPELTFTWYDAAVLSQKIRQTAEVEKTHCGVNRLPLSSDPFQSDDIV